MSRTTDAENIDYLVFDSFASRAFEGNPAAVVRIPSGVRLRETTMQRIAGEFALSQTAFVGQQEGGQWAIRWFSPRQEVPLCGHATLAACFALREWGLWDTNTPLEWSTLRRGILPCRWLRGRVGMSFPASSLGPARLPHGVGKALGLAGARVAAVGGPLLLALELSSSREVREATPHLPSLFHWHRHGVALTAIDEEGEGDFVTRMFAPRMGIDEDPACGSAHTALGPWWQERLGKPRLIARQLSARGGIVEVHCAGPGEDARVELLGRAVQVMRGTLRVPIDQR